MNGGSAERKESARNILFFWVGIYHQKKRGFGIRNGRKERRMKDDTISRQAANDALENIDCSDGIGISALKCDVVKDALNAIKALPPAQLAQRWIPCSERLPEPDRSVLVQL